MGGYKFATVRFGSESWRLAPGAEVSFGRGEARTVRFGYEPEDTYVSPQAGTLFFLDDAVPVRNDSRTQPLTLRTFPGPEYVLDPRGAMSSPAHTYVRVIVPGSWGSQYVLAIDSDRERPMTNDANLAGTDTAVKVAALSPTTSRGIPTLTKRERQLLEALREPFLTLAGSESAPATYRQIAERLNLASPHARNRLDSLRDTVADLGIPGRRSDADNSSRTNLSARLAMWRICRGAIDEASLSLLDEDTGSIGTGGG